MPLVGLSLPVIRLVHPSTGRRVTFLSMMHIGEKEYYEACRKVIEHHKGAVLYEGVGRPTVEEREDLSDGQLLITQDFDALGKFYELIADLMGFVSQSQEIRIAHDVWHHADISWVDFVREWEAAAIPLMEFEKVGKSLPPIKVEQKEPLKIALRAFVWSSMKGRITSALPEKLERLLLDRRNQKALEVFDRVPETMHVLFIYGAAHGDGIVRGLRKRGFREESRIHLRVFSIAKGAALATLILTWPFMQIASLRRKSQMRQKSERIQREGYVAVYGKPNRVPSWIIGNAPEKPG